MKVNVGIMYRDVVSVLPVDRTYSYKLFVKMTFKWLCHDAKTSSQNFEWILQAENNEAVSDKILIQVPKQLDNL